MSDEFDPMAGRYTGTAGGLFGLVMHTSLLTLLTFGLYRFWAKTRVRRYIWSATAPGGDPFEYTGTGLEKFFGFLFAIVILAVVLGLFQLGLFYAGLSFLNLGPDSSAWEVNLATFMAQLSVIVILPLIYIAQYRARRYKMSRTRWRGLRFGMEDGAFGYMVRAIGHSFLTGLTFGLLLPRQTYYLAKYQTDRTWYGNSKFSIDCGWGVIYPAMKHSLIGVAIILLSAGVSLITPAAGVGVIVGYFWLMFGIVHYRVASYITLTENTVLGDNIRFGAVPSSFEVVGRIILGSMVVGTLATIVGGALIAASFFSLGISFDAIESGAVPEISPMGAVVAALSVLFTIIFYQALNMVFIVQPITRIIIENTAVLNPDGLRKIRQREGQDQVDADGFADALDVGGAF